ncbi:DUF4349 domain-containing protein [Microbacterium sp. NPDC058342]|uniref:DUF4349 domain-containing protein n=1 Tax=Microbacterium sp. NPDC058342 TaxID=3346454 RepID=UPI00364C8EF0
MNEHEEAALPPLSDESIARIERAVLDEIDDDRIGAVPRATPAGHRRRRWVTALGVAAAFAAGILVAPPLLTAVTGAGSASDEAGAGSFAFDTAQAPAVGSAESMAGGGNAAADGEVLAEADEAATGRDIITTAQLTLRVTDVDKAARALAELAREHGGYVESEDIGLDPGHPADGAAEGARSAGSGWISIRIPAADLGEVIAAVGREGQVLGSSISRQDVTSTAIDLRARVDATRASVERLTELMTKSGSVGDLITAETALNERQAQLESYEQQLAALDDQVAMSTVRMELTERTSPTTADPAGFGDGLLAGWNGLVVALNALVVAVGFLLPWLVIAGAALAVIWLIRRAKRRAVAGRRSAKGSDASG